MCLLRIRTPMHNNSYRNLVSMTHVIRRSSERQQHSGRHFIAQALSIDLLLTTMLWAGLKLLPMISRPLMVSPPLPPPPSPIDHGKTSAIDESKDVSKMSSCCRPVW